MFFFLIIILFIYLFIHVCICLLRFYNFIYSGSHFDGEKATNNLDLLVKNLFQLALIIIGMVVLNPTKSSIVKQHSGQLPPCLFSRGSRVALQLHFAVPSGFQWFSQSSPAEWLSSVNRADILGIISSLLSSRTPRLSCCVQRIGPASLTCAGDFTNTAFFFLCGLNFCDREDRFWRCAWVKTNFIDK